MTKQEVIESFCRLAMVVSGEVFKYQESVDCFCRDGKEPGGYCFSHKVLEFIEQAVDEKIAADKRVGRR